MAKVPDEPQYMERCICGTCPTYPGEGGFFCAKGKSTLPITGKGWGRLPSIPSGLA